MIDDPDDYKFYVEVWLSSAEKLHEMGEWLDENTAGDWVYQFGRMNFVESTDAVFFRLKFCV